MQPRAGWPHLQGDHTSRGRQPPAIRRKRAELFGLIAYRIVSPAGSLIILIQRCAACLPLPARRDSSRLPPPSPLMMRPTPTAAGPPNRAPVVMPHFLDRAGRGGRGPQVTPSEDAPLYASHMWTMSVTCLYVSGFASLFACSGAMRDRTSVEMYDRQRRAM